MSTELLKILTHIRNDIPVFPKDDVGICGLIKQHVLFSITATEILLIDEARMLWRKWPKYSGSEAFPVPAPGYDYSGGASDAFFMEDHKWSGEYGANRIELLNWLIKELQA